MTGIVINNNKYQVSTGNTKIEYNSMGGESVGYSMYGDNVPYTDVWTPITLSQLSQLGTASSTYSLTSYTSYADPANVKAMLSRQNSDNLPRSSKYIEGRTGSITFTITYNQPIYVEYLKFRGWANPNDSSGRMGVKINDEEFIYKATPKYSSFVDIEIVNKVINTWKFFILGGDMGSFMYLPYQTPKIYAKK